MESWNFEVPLEWTSNEAIRNVTVLIWNEPSEYHRCEVGLEQVVSLAGQSEPNNLLYLAVEEKIVKGLAE